MRERKSELYILYRMPVVGDRRRVRCRVRRPFRVSRAYEYIQHTPQAFPDFLSLSPPEERHLFFRMRRGV